MRPDANDRLFTRVLVEGTDEAIAEWVGVGPAAVGRLRKELSGRHRAVLPDDVSSRDVLDNLGWAAHQVAAAFPDEFLAAFHDARWDDNASVCFGLGAIRRRDVTERLMRILTTGDHWRRIDAAVALRGHRHPELRAALRAASQDPDGLVRYHAQERLSELDNEPPPSESVP